MYIHIQMAFTWYFKLGECMEGGAGSVTAANEGQMPFIIIVKFSLIGNVFGRCTTYMGNFHRHCLGMDAGCEDDVWYLV